MGNINKNDKYELKFFFNFIFYILFLGYIGRIGR